MKPPLDLERLSRLPPRDLDRLTRRHRIWMDVVSSLLQSGIVVSFWAGVLMAVYTGRGNADIVRDMIYLMLIPGLLLIGAGVVVGDAFDPLRKYEAEDGK